MNRLQITLSTTLMAVALTAACGGSNGSGNGAAGTSGGAGSALVTTARNSGIGSNVLVSRTGMTLYTLSAESRNRFICTKGATVPGSGSTQCLSLWRPLLLAPGASLTGTVRSLGVVMRPDGVGTQVTYRGLPLYTFVEDRKPGDALGNGFKDVGTWAPVRVGAGGAAAPTSSSGGGRYGY
jgi:predicted lipoprotein with Yx(FWY)xxD motif